LSEMKVCTKCGEEFPNTKAYFNKQNSCRCGLTRRCKKCLNDYAKKYAEKNKCLIKKYKDNYYSKNRDRILAGFAVYREENKDTLSMYARKYREENRERMLPYWKKRYMDNKEAMSEAQKKHRQANIEQYRIYKVKYYHKHIEKMREIKRIESQIRRTKKRKLPSTLTAEQWNEIVTYFDGKCAYCGKEKPLEQEHFIALTNGGEYTHNNIIAACKSCNSSKRNHDFFEWYPDQRFYSKKREEKILTHLNYDKNHQQQLSLI